jgi:hypothetical protein
MSRTRSALTAEIQSRVINFIKAGGFPHVAAEAAGVSQQLFLDWLAKGNRRGAKEPYRSFVRAVDEAIAQARLGVEIEVRKKDPRFWLRYGPGRESDKSPGWGTVRKPTLPVKPRGLSKLPPKEWSRLCRLIFSTLEAFPEARAAVAQALQSPGAGAALLLPPPRSNPRKE